MAPFDGRNLAPFRWDAGVLNYRNNVQYVGFFCDTRFLHCQFALYSAQVIKNSRIDAVIGSVVTLFKDWPRRVAASQGFWRTMARVAWQVFACENGSSLTHMFTPQCIPPSFPLAMVATF